VLLVKPCLLYIQSADISRKLRVAWEISKLLIELYHIFSHFKDSIAKGLWRKHLDLVAVAEYPPAYLADTVNAEFHNS